ncbi:MAG: tRNA epoxyqueuosine(34) reductase QueG [Janthinobacterium lividum]
MNSLPNKLETERTDVPTHQDERIVAPGTTPPPDAAGPPLGSGDAPIRPRRAAHPLAPPTPAGIDRRALAQRIDEWAQALGFDATGVADIDLHDAERGLAAWLAAGFHGQMDYMVKHGMKRARPAELVPGTVCVLSVRMAYLPASLAASAQASAARRPPRDWRDAEWQRLHDPSAAVVSVYARGRDYHKVMRQRLQRLVDRIADDIGPFGYRVFADSAPVMEVELARRAGLGWRGKHTLLLHREAGSFFFLGEIYLDISLPLHAGAGAAPTPVYLNAPDAVEAAGPSARSTDSDAAVDVSFDGTGTGTAASQTASKTADGSCGHCTRCLDVCPTQAIVAPYLLDARRCISYLTIEHRGSIPEVMREAIGNRIYGCDDCQLVCPWNKFARVAVVDDFEPRNGLERASLAQLFEWTEQDFETRLAGSPIRRIGHEQWLRNLAVGLGNALRAERQPAARGALIAALARRRDDPSVLVREHVEWALQGSADSDKETACSMP